MPNRLLRLENERLEGQKHSLILCAQNTPVQGLRRAKCSREWSLSSCKGDGLDHGFPVGDVHPCLWWGHGNWPSVSKLTYVPPFLPPFLLFSQENQESWLFIRKFIISKCQQMIQRFKLAWANSTKAKLKTSVSKIQLVAPMKWSPS